MAVDTSDVREAHGAATADVDCELIWNKPFLDTNYSYVVNGFDADGNPVMLLYVSRTATKITVKALVDCTVLALAKPYNP